jgi:hypothetical protein
MDEDKIIRFLRCPASAVVDLALEMANLTWKEYLAIDLCGRKAKTQEVAAKEADRSVDAMQKWYRSGIKKLSTAWYGVWWIEKLSEG